jgi:hypothetical protein
MSKRFGIPKIKLDFKRFGNSEVLEIREVNRNMCSCFRINLFIGPYQTLNKLWQF